jgi:hypothetical protein
VKYHLAPDGIQFDNRAVSGVRCDPSILAGGGESAHEDGFADGGIERRVVWPAAALGGKIVEACEATRKGARLRVTCELLCILAEKVSSFDGGRLSVAVERDAPPHVGLGEQRKKIVAGHPTHLDYLKVGFPGLIKESHRGGMKTHEGEQLFPATMRKPSPLPPDPSQEIGTGGGVLR